MFSTLFIGRKKCLLTRCFTGWVYGSNILRESGRLFEIVGPMWERLMYPWLVFRKGWFIFSKCSRNYILLSSCFQDLRSLCHWVAEVDTDRLTGWIRRGEIWQLNFWIWILQAEWNYVRIQFLRNTDAFILCVKVFIFLRFGSFLFRKCIPLLSFSGIDTLRDSNPDLKISTRSVTVYTFN